MRRKIRAALDREVTMPRWAIALDFVYRCFLVLAASVVIVLWWQAATRDEEADRNARIQSCSAGYAATSAAWDSLVVTYDQQSESLDRHAETLYSRIVARAAQEQPLGDLPARYEMAQQAAEARTQDAVNASARVEEMTRRRLGLAEFSAASVDAGKDFECPPLPADLVVESIPP